MEMTPEQLRNKSLNENLEAEYLKETEEEHKKLFPKLTDKQWLEVFPEAEEDYILPRIAELKKMKQEIEKNIRGSLEKIRDKPDSWFWEDKIVFFQGEDLLNVERQISSLKNLLFVVEKRPERQTVKRGVSKDETSKAKSRSIVSVVQQNIKLIKTGGNYKGLCPFHHERTPSLCIYPKTNSYHCFGCQKSGNLINYIMDFYHFNFIEAVRYLNNNY